MPDDLKLNTLERFIKQPGRLALQEYSHCEVPAGCGGVVLRWIDPAAGRFVTVDVYAWAREVEMRVDGMTVEQRCIQLTDGGHVLMLRTSPAPTREPPAVMVALALDTRASASPAGSRLGTGVNCRWTVVPESTPEGMFTDLGELGVSAVGAPRPPESPDDRRRLFRFNSTAEPLVLPEEGWLRCCFHVSEAGIS